METLMIWVFCSDEGFYYLHLPSITGIIIAHCGIPYESAFLMGCDRFFVSAGG